jgi:hypothetical protein
MAQTPEKLRAGSNFMLGVSLVMQQKLTPDAAVCLEVASGKYPKARLSSKRLRQTEAHSLSVCSLGICNEGNLRTAPPG